MQILNDVDSRRCRTVLVDDHPLFCAGLRAVLADDPRLEVLDEARDAEHAMVLVRELRPELALVDLQLPTLDGADLTAQLREQAPTCRVIGISASEDPLAIAAMLRAGAVGF